ncbi:hypothetical protein ABEB36_004616 [Hypothenemus hampei]|uniref:Uncharacterized protein n=1 Tax=Hypothenemus hampei TaxID=57062 RepID=A0ABD1F3X0_HYPHA
MIGMASSWLLTAPPNIQSVEIIFPVTRHSYIPPDRIFGFIEKEIKKHEGEPFYRNIIGAPKNICKKGKSIGNIKPNIIHEKNMLKEEKKKDIDALLSKHYGTQWRNIKEVDFSFYKHVINEALASEDTDAEEDLICEKLEEICDLRCKGKCFHVCKEAFAALHEIGKKRAERVCSLLARNAPPHDLRGKTVRNMKPQPVRETIHNHIKKFDVKQTHYGGAVKNYLDARLNVKIMHELFINENPELRNSISYKYYLEYFKRYFRYTSKEKFEK